MAAPRRVRSRSMPKKAPRRVRWRWFILIPVGWIALSILLVLPLRWLPPATSSFMIQRWVATQFAPDESVAIAYEWVDWSAIPDQVKLAVIAAEDQRFAYHRGFDLIEMQRAWQDHRDGKRLRGASTISQQTAKNLYLWPGRDPFRKALEAWLTLLIETFWSKQRILEIYLNIAQLGPDTFGVGAASWRYFDRPVSALSLNQATLIAATLPNPSLNRLSAPTPTMQRRAASIRRQMNRLGGVKFLEQL
ncbi:MAG: monofunctional biosynthetic peptidoglycan transglycosylase [Sphingobacteriia bacterium]|nr:monofunctional biosynthetic peptidoglycan transglycosylase [Sphingobacteriia bacterium]NCC39679.1 monofunctional biosynthetic peptidoglycan transglycosylase [Gammaproteobacteria bacterium]